MSLIIILMAPVALFNASEYALPNEVFSLITIPLFLPISSAKTLLFEIKSSVPLLLTIIHSKSLFDLAI